jgi:hypothetical protein
MKEWGVEEIISTPLPKRDLCQVRKKNHTGQEFNMTRELVGYGMDRVMLDLGFDVNILLKMS